MKHLPTIFLLSGLTALIGAGCRKSEIPAGSVAAASVYFFHTIYEDNVDSLNYSFVTKDPDIKQDTVWLPVRITGAAASFDRVVNLVALDSATTAVAGTHYRLLNYVIPKDSFLTNLGVVVLRSPDLRDTVVRLTLQIRPSKDFTALMKDTVMADGRNLSRTKVRINITDRLIKPDNWDKFLVYFFGTYSQVKFRFIVNELGVASFPTTGPNAIGLGQIFYYQSVMENAIADYNAAHGPMIDEFGNPVVFP